MKKVALINTTNSISKLWTTPSNEIFGIKKMLNNIGYKVDIISKKENKELGILNVDYVKNLDDYDKVLIVPGTLAFYHNNPKGNIFKIYSLLSKMHKNIYVLSTDVTVHFEQLYKQAKRFMNIKEEDINITAPIVFISQTQETAVINKLIDKNNFNVRAVKSFSIDIFSAYLSRISKYTWRNYDEIKKEYDVIYGGAWRGGRRSDAFYKYLCDNPFNTALYGTIKQKQLDKLVDKYNVEKFPKILKKIPGNKVIEENSKGLVTFVPGEKNMSQMTTARIWESMLSSAVTLIEESYDPTHSISPYDFVYLSGSKDEFIEKVNKIKNDNSFRLDLVNKQHNLIYNLDFDKWLDDFNNILNIE